MSQKHRKPILIGKRETCFVSQPNKNELVAILFRRHKRELIRRGIIQDPAKRPPRYKFQWVYGEINGVVYADDRSTARGLIKRELGIRKKNRLPVGIDITRELNIKETDKDSVRSSCQGGVCQ